MKFGFDEIKPVRFYISGYGIGDWQEYVISEPGCKRNIPSFPKFSDITCKIGIGEVLHDIKTKQFSYPNCNIGISGKISIYLNSKKNIPKIKVLPEYDEESVNIKLA